MCRRAFGLVSLLSLFALVGCSASPAESTAKADAPLATGGPVHVRGPTRLRGSCHDSLGGMNPFEVDAGQTRGIFLAYTDFAFNTVQVSLGEGPEHLGTIRSHNTPAWSAEGKPSVEVSKPLALGQMIELHDPALAEGLSVDCAAELVEQPMQGLHVNARTSVALDALDTPLLVATLPLPNHFVCGLALDLDSPTAATAADDLKRALSMTEETGLVVTRTTERRLELTTPNNQDWSATITIESTDHQLVLGDVVASTLGTSGRLVGIACPAK